MHSLLLVAIIVVGSLGFIKRIPSGIATWIVVSLTVLGVFTSRGGFQTMFSDPAFSVSSG